MFFSIVYPSHLLVFLCMCECIWVFLPEINFTYLLTYLLTSYDLGIIMTIYDFKKV